MVAGCATQLLSVDLATAASVQTVFERVRPAVVILTAAQSNVDGCEDDSDRAYQINVEGTRHVVALCEKYNARLVFYSSEYVFDGTDGPYDEEDVPHPLSIYGKTKYAAEQIIGVSSIPSIIIRTTVVYGRETRNKNFVYWLVNSLRQGTPVKVVQDQISSPTYAYNLAEVTEALLRNNKTGVYNVVGTDVVSRFAFAQEICRVFDLDASLITPVCTAQLRQKAPRPLRAGLRIEKVAQAISIPLLGITEGLQRYKNELATMENKKDIIV